MVTAAYPPATYLMLWPLLGWLDLGAARWLWAAVTLPLLLLLSLLLRRAVVTPDRLSLAALLIAVPAGYSATACIFLSMSSPALMRGLRAVETPNLNRVAAARKGDQEGMSPD